jgi:hypothetical protein
MWRGIDALPNSDVLYRVMRLAKLGMTLVGTSVMDERALSTMILVKRCLHASLRTHLPLYIRMKLQEQYDFEMLSYSALQLSSESIFLAMH